MRIEEYQDRNGKSLFREWFNNLDPQTARIISMALTRLQIGNTSNIKNVGSGVFERKVDHGPGYRIYFGKGKEDLIILLIGGTKKRQSQDIERAKLLWKEFKCNKKLEVPIWH